MSRNDRDSAQCQREYALCFDGVLSGDKLVNELYEKGRAMLDLFTKHVPQPPRRKKGKAAMSAKAPSNLGNVA